MLLLNVVLTFHVTAADALMTYGYGNYIYIYICGCDRFEFDFDFDGSAVVFVKG